jgi:hypothetical protein
MMLNIHKYTYIMHDTQGSVEVARTVLHAQGLKRREVRGFSLYIYTHMAAAPFRIFQFQSNIQIQNIYIRMDAALL